MAKNSIMELLLLKGARIRNELEKGMKKAFTEVVVHSGDAQAMGRKPVTFLRQVTAICTYTKLLTDQTLPHDTKQRARKILDNCEGKSIGSYTNSAGISYILNNVAKYIEKRDGGIPADPKNIYLVGGTDKVMDTIFKLLIDTGGPTKTGIMIPIPCNPVLSESISLLNGAAIHYSLDEERGWSLDMMELRRALFVGQKHCIPKALCIINPGSPTGQVLSRSCIQRVIQFAADHGLFLLADEAHQENVHSEDNLFHSFKKVLFEMGPKYSSTVELVSFFSVSKGHLGECGARGCLMEVTNLDPQVHQYLNKLVSTSTGCSVTAQIAIDVTADSPQPGDPSYLLFMTEKQSFQRKMAEKAHLTEEMLNSVPGMHCNPIHGGIYAYPRIEIPAKAREAAKALHQEPDLFYCLKLLEVTGHLLTPGNVFGQRDGTYHFRMSFLPPIESLKIALKMITQFQQRFTADFS